MSIKSSPQKYIRWRGGGGTTNANTASRAITFTTGLLSSDVFLCVSNAEGTASITGISQTNVTWAQLDVVGNTPRVEVWLGRPTGSPGGTATISYNASNFGSATIGVFENLLGKVLARATGSSNAMTAMVAPKDNCMILFCIGQNTFGSYYTWFSGRYLMNLFPSALSTAGQYVGAFWGIIPKGTSVSGTAQRSNATTGTLRSLTLALV